MTPLAIALAVAVLALLWWAAKPLNTNHAERDEKATGSGGRDVEPGIIGWDVTPIHQEER